MPILHGIAPCFSVRDVAAALAFYDRLGFATRVYEHGGYGYATLGAVEIHLGTRSKGSNIVPSTAYLFVDDADAWAEQWIAAGVDVGGPEDTDWSRREGVIIDPDGNILRFGSPL